MHYMRLRALVAVNIKIMILRDVTLCRLLQSYRLISSVFTLTTDAKFSKNIVTYIPNYTAEYRARWLKR